VSLDARLSPRGIPLEDLPIHRAGWDVFVPRLATAATGGDPGPNPIGGEPPPG
jgi:hypothetical protein